jgi:AcrR family transcriptional regulator
VTSSASTRARILEAALRLFNRRGSVSVTTHDIADACGISPGNLYYHFRNKEEIIRALFEDALAMHQRQVAGTGRDPQAAPFPGDLGFLKEFNWRYRFFKRELPTLLARDGSLRRAYLAFQTAHLQQLDTVLRDASRRGILRPLDARTRRMLVELSWLVALFWPTFIEVTGAPVSRANVDRAADVLRLLFAAVQTPAAAPVPSRTRAGATR